MACMETNMLLWVPWLTKSTELDFGMVERIAPLKLATHVVVEPVNQFLEVRAYGMNIREKKPRFDGT